MITKQVIASAAYDLMTRKSLDKITVKDIAAECHITRQTFYYHFKDILDLLEWGIRQEREQLLKRSQECESMEEAMLTYVQMINDSDRMPLIRKVFKSRYRDAFHVFMVRESKLYFIEVCRQKKLLENLPIKEAEFLIEFYSGALINLYGKWLADDHMDMEAGTRMAIRVMRGELHI